jgi:hypothetical protein
MYGPIADIRQLWYTKHPGLRQTCGEAIGLLSLDGLSSSSAYQYPGSSSPTIPTIGHACTNFAMTVFLV